MLAAELSCAAIMICNFIFQQINTFEFDAGWICFGLIALLLAAALGVIFMQLQTINKKLAGIFSDARLMCLHFITFIAATIADAIIAVLVTFGSC